jgi:hypothetical protein
VRFAGPNTGRFEGIYPPSRLPPSLKLRWDKSAGWQDEQDGRPQPKFAGFMPSAENFSGAIYRNLAQFTSVILLLHPCAKRPVDFSLQSPALSLEPQAFSAWQAIWNYLKLSWKSTTYMNLSSLPSFW